MKPHIAVPEEVLRDILRHADHATEMIAYVRLHDRVVASSVAAIQFDVDRITNRVAGLLGEAWPAGAPRLRSRTQPYPTTDELLPDLDGEHASERRGE